MPDALSARQLISALGEHTMVDIDINKANLIISAVSSLATFVTMFLVLLTLFEMAKQRKSAYKPDIVIEPPRYFLSSKAKGGRILSMSISEEDLSAQETKNKKLLENISLRSFNIGLGAAKFVSVDWEYNVDELIQRVNEGDKKSSFEIDKPVEGHVKISILEDGVSVTVNTSYHDYYGYMLPTHVKNDATFIPFPFAYLALTAASMFLQWANEGEEWAENTKFPALKMKLSYIDIGSNKHSKSFKVQPMLGYGSASETKNKEEVKNFAAMIMFGVDEEK